MENIFENYNKIFFVGIGGISMSGLAKILKSMGKKVWGSDLAKSQTTKSLKAFGIKVFFKHATKNVKDADLVVYSGAIKQDNPELLQAKKKNIKIVERSELLHMVSTMYKNVIAVSGTHGKTTTTGMIAHAFMISGLKPTVHIGGELDCIGGNVCVGSDEFFITEACEFRDSFLTLKPNVSVITNIENEHLDYFKNFENEKKSFCKFVDNTSEKCFASCHCKKFLKDKNLCSYGNLKSDNLIAKNIKKGQDNKYSFDCFKNSEYIGNFKVNVYGKHNIENALATIGVCLHYGISYHAIYLALKTFENAHRRFENVGVYKKSLVIQDYAHHPTEIKNTIKTCKEVFQKKIVCVFQPHTYSRTKSLWESFSTCFDGVDKLFVIKTYSARESFDFEGSAEFLASKILERKPNFEVVGALSKREFLKKIRDENLDNSILLFLGAGDIEKIPKKMIK